MEFSKEILCPDLDVAHLKNVLTIKSLPELCASIDTVISEEGDTGEIYCLWGEFGISRLEIRYGVRFSLLNCPHALAWSITLDEENNNIIIHCTTDKKEQDPDFVGSIHEFVTDWARGLSEIFL